VVVAVVDPLPQQLKAAAAAVVALKRRLQV
jgi:hypothetical protein